MSKWGSDHLSTSDELKANRAIERAASLPEILVTDRFMRDITADCIKLLQTVNEGRPRFFRFGDVLAEVTRRIDAGAAVNVLQTANLRGVLDRLGNFVRMKGGNQVPGRPPNHVLSDILSLNDLPLPELQGVVGAPFFAGDGTLVTTNGHDVNSGYYLDLPDGLTLRNISPAPTAEDTAEAKRVIFDELLVDFPFVDEADRAHAVSLLLSRFVRSLMNGPTPLMMVESPTPGTGKDLLVQALTIPAMGDPVPVMTEGRDEDEWRKRLTSKLMDAPQFILIDNVCLRLDSAALSAALSSPIWEDRIMGVSRIITLPVRCTWIATANNPTLSLEIARRTVPIRIDSGFERPWQREEFRHPDLLGWVRQHRSDLIWAATTLVQAWIVAGKPSGQKSLGGYESWSKVMGGILQVNGIRGFLGNTDRVHEQADRDVGEWREFCEAWWQEFQDASVASGQLYDLATRRRLLMSIYGGQAESNARTRFGIAMASMKDRVLDGYKILRDTPHGRTKTQRYRLVRLGGLRGVAGGFSDPESETHVYSNVEIDQPPSLVRVTEKSESGPENVPQPPATSREDPWDSFFNEESDELS